MKIYFIYSTFKNAKSAKLLASKLVKNKLAACTNIIPAIYSTYVWKNKKLCDEESSSVADEKCTRRSAANDHGNDGKRSKAV